MSPTDHDPDRVRLLHILEIGREIARLVAGRERTDLNDRQFAYSLYWTITVIGEAASHISKEFKNRHSEIEWEAMVRTRNRVVHGYMTLNDDIVWRIATVHVPANVALLDAIQAAEFLSRDDSTAST